MNLSWKVQVGKKGHFKGIKMWWLRFKVAVVGRKSKLSKRVLVVSDWSVGFLYMCFLTLLEIDKYNMSITWTSFDFIWISTATNRCA